MSERSSYEPGTPCWVEYSSPDLDASIEFYGGLFGWAVPETENAEQTGGYRIALKDGKPAAGMMPQMEEGQPAAWATYVSVADADAAAAAVKENGGNVVAEPMSVMDLGRMSIFTDPGGAFFGVWQPGSFIGAQIVNEPGGIAWNELNTRDYAGAKSFYGGVFGWGFDESTPGEEPYGMIVPEGGERPVGGVLDLDARNVPAEIPPHWQVYFGVEDTDATIEKAKASGGGVMMEPIEIPFGRFAILTDPHGAAFAVIALSEAGQENA
jgi:predicted enzyme related to lactoylglutathione lyase